MSSFLLKFRKFVGENRVLIIFGGGMIATHYFWAKLQNTALARNGNYPPQELPPIIFAKFIYRKSLEKYNSIMEPKKDVEKNPAP